MSCVTCRTIYNNITEYPFDQAFDPFFSTEYGERVITRFITEALLWFRSPFTTGLLFMVHKRCGVLFLI